MRIFANLAFAKLFLTWEVIFWEFQSFIVVIKKCDFRVLEIGIKHLLFIKQERFLQIFSIMDLSMKGYTAQGIFIWLLIEGWFFSWWRLKRFMVLKFLVFRAKIAGPDRVTEEIFIRELGHEGQEIKSVILLKASLTNYMRQLGNDLSSIFQIHPSSQKLKIRLILHGGLWNLIRGQKIPQRAVIIDEKMILMWRIVLFL